jgi:thiosulfate reductase cytochrome b subunit
VFGAVPALVVTGLTMSPAVTAAFPFLLTVFGGYQSARTLHFAAFAALMLFAAVHVAMVVRSGFRRQMRGMILGRTS